MEVSFRKKCPAKVNLALRILGKGPDGYHKLGSVMTPLWDIADEIDIATGVLEDTTDEISDRNTMNSVEVFFSCNSPFGDQIPEDDSNLVVRAIRKFFERYFQKNPYSPIMVSAHLEKKIPPQAGLGGGSSNAAQVFAGLNEGLGNPFNQGEIWEMAAELGSDIPFFLENKTSLVEGRGELVTPLKLDEIKWYAVVVKPPQGLSTAEVYRQFPSDEYSEDHTWAETREDILVSDKMSIEWAQNHLYNDLEIPAFRIMPELQEIQELIARSGAFRVLMSGSGSAMVGLFQDEQLASDAYKEVQQTLVLKEDPEWFIGFSRL
jgi:4-diphosphocytidyl-2-C-methyl-D-erythritol kinase